MEDVVAEGSSNRGGWLPWVLLIIAGVLEIFFALSLKGSHGFTRLWPSIGVCAFGGASFLLLNIALKSLAVGTAYAVWTGLGAAGTVAAGMVFLNEPVNAGRLIAFTLVIAGIIGLRLYEH
jgi:quaternary ammonium compound-resistance protein SugE